jgi:hypothetical protein
MNVLSELEEAVREQGVRVDERLAILRDLADPDGEELLRRRIAELEGRIREAARVVRGTLS